MSSSIVMRLGGLMAGAATLALPVVAGAQAYPGQNYPNQNYPTPSYPAQQGYPSASQGYPTQGYPAQGYPATRGYPPASSYDERANAPVDDENIDEDYATTAPDGYGPGQPPPPPPGYSAEAGYPVSAEADQRYEAYVEDWAQRYCVRSRNNTGAGAVIGGLFGALLGSGVAGWRDRGAGAVIGGLAGAGAGAAIGSSTSNATSPGCPPGYVVRGGAPVFAYGGYGGVPYDYAAPGWYQPWIYAGGRWDYRPYPYHSYYYRTYGRLGGPPPRYGWHGGGWGGRGYYPGYRQYRGW